MLNTQLSNVTVNAQAQAIIDALADGFVRVYNGTQPVNGDAPITTQTLLAELRLQNPAAPAPVAGLITFAPTTPANALAQGTASFYRLVASDGVTVVLDGSVGRTNANMLVSNTTIIAGARVTLTGLTHQVDKSFTGT